ncbi:MAG: alcohol dehydrogenase catalytic domain-containing protein [Actinomycetota bacterium]|nr:alcohol dehydrogenase catalytic domain-containing protein [Actinomycetota bacterium]
MRGDDMSSMKAVELVEPRQVRLVEREIPRPGRGEVLVRIKACAICTLERRLFTGEQKLFYPLVFGHEVSGVVEEVGEGVFSDFIPGEPVVLDLLNRCGECYLCRTGHSNQCVNKFDPGLPVLGGMAQFVSRPAREVFRINRQVGFLNGALTEPLSDCVHSLMRTHLSPEMSIFVIGAGTMGLLHLAIVKHYGMFAAVSDVHPEKLALASRLGADYVIDVTREDQSDAFRKHTGLDGADVVIVTAPGLEPIEEALEAVGTLGVIVFFSANPKGIRIELDPNFVHYREVTITGSESRTEKDFYQAVSMQNSGDLSIEGLVSAVFLIEEAQRALEASLDPAMYRVVVAMDDTALEEFETAGGV